MKRSKVSRNTRSKESEFKDYQEAYIDFISYYPDAEYSDDIDADVTGITSASDAESDSELDLSNIRSSNYASDVKSRIDSWPNVCNSYMELLLKNKTIHGRKCSKASCTLKAEYLCQSCVKYCALCENHSRIHQQKKDHSLLNILGINFKARDMSNLVSDSTSDQKLFVTLSGWFFSNRSTDEIKIDGKWFPATPNRPRTFLHQKLLELASLLQESMLSVDTIVSVIEKYHQYPPPSFWKSNFNEALRLFSSIKIMIKHGMFDFSNNFKLRTVCPACNVGPDYKGTIIMVYIFI